MKYVLCFLLLISSGSFAQTLYRQDSKTTNALNTISFAGDSENFGAAVGANATYATSGDYGQNWNAFSLPGFGNLYCEAFNDSSSGAAGSDAGVLLVKIPGEAPMPVQLPMAKAIRAIMYPTTDSIQQLDTMVCAGEGGLLFRSVDSGKSWSQINLPAQLANHNFYGLSYFDDSTYWVVGSGGVVIYTEDAGSHWQRILVPTTKDLYSISFPSDGSTGWIVGDQTLLYTTDIGNTWTNIPTTASLRAVTGYGAGSDGLDTGYAVGLGGVLLRTFDRVHWSPISTGTTANFYGVDIPDSLYFVGDSGIIMTTLPPPQAVAQYQSTGYIFSRILLGQFTDGWIDIFNNSIITDTFSSIVISGSNFSLDTNPGQFILMPGQQRSFQVRWTPSRIGPDSGFATITSLNAGVRIVPLIGYADAASSVTEASAPELLVSTAGHNLSLELPSNVEYPLQLRLWDERGIERYNKMIVGVSEIVTLNDATGPYFYRLSWPTGTKTGKFIIP